MRVRLHIDALSVEADWPRSARPEFAERVKTILARELLAAARRGAFGRGGIAARCSLTLPEAAFNSPAGAGSGIARTITGAIAGAGAGHAGARR